MSKKTQEWFRQAEYDIKTAGHLFNGGRHIYAVFMCHLSIEKALKGLYQRRLDKIPPKVHNLTFLAEKTGLKFPEDLFIHLASLNTISIPTRYPEDLKKMQKDYTKKKTAEIMRGTAEVLRWLKKQFKER